MVAFAKQVGDKRYRESYGRYFEDFEIGHVYEHRPGRTITETDNIQFSLLTDLFCDRDHHLPPFARPGGSPDTCIALAFPRGEFTTTRR